MINQLAPTAYESWDGRDALTPVKALTVEEKARETSVDRIERQTSETKNQLKRIGNLESSMSSAHAKIEAVFPVLQDLGQELQEQKAQNTLIIGMLAQREHIRARTASAEIKVGTAEKLANIELRKEKWKAIWAWVGRSAAGASVIIALIAGWMKCR